MTDSNVTDINVARARQGKKAKKPLAKPHKNRNFVICPFAILDCDLPANAKLLWLYLKSNTDSYMPTQKTIMAHSGLKGRDTVIKAKGILLRHNMIGIDTEKTKYGGDRHLIHVKPQSKWVGVKWNNPRSDKSKAGPVSGPAAGRKTGPAAGPETGPIEQSKEIDNRIDSSSANSNSLPSVTEDTQEGEPETSPETPLIEKLRAFNPITAKLPPKEKNAQLRHIIDRFEWCVLLAFIADVQGYGMIFGTARIPLGEMQRSVEFFIAERYKK